METLGSRILRCSALALAILSLVVSRVHAVDFLRGDANHDGEVTFADAQAIFNTLFRGVPERAPCEELMDFTDDGRIQVVDGIQLARFLVHGTPTPAQPFPDIGPDPEGFHHPCSSYGGGEPLIEPTAVMAVWPSSIPGGTAPRRALVAIALTHSVEVAGYMGRIVDEAGVIEDIPEDNINNQAGGFGDSLADVSGAFDGGFISGRKVEDRISFGFLTTSSGSVRLHPAVDREVLRIPVCVKIGTPAGTYPLTLELGELVDFESGRSIRPELVSGTLTVEEEVAATPCSVTRGGQGTLFRLEDTVASPGSEVDVPFYLTTNRSASGLQISVDFDETLLEAVDIRSEWERPDGEPYAIAMHVLHNDDVNAGNDLATEGAVGAFYLATAGSEETLIPIDEEIQFLTLRFRVKPDAPPGTTELRFYGSAPHQPGALAPQPVPDESNPGGCTALVPHKECFFFDYYQNLLFTPSSTYNPSLQDSFFLVNGLLQIIADVGFFRGDANADGKVDISDSNFTLSHLFLGERPPPCADAADANDDGRLDISDAVIILNYLFRGTSTLPPPVFPRCGPDVTPDRLGCAGVQFCL